MDDRLKQEKQRYEEKADELHEGQQKYASLQVTMGLLNVILYFI